MKKKNKKIEKQELMEVRLLLDLLNLEANVNTSIQRDIEWIRNVIRQSRKYSSRIYKSMDDNLEFYSLYIEKCVLFHLAIIKEQDKVLQMNVYTYKDINAILCGEWNGIDYKSAHQLTKKELEFRTPDIIIERDYIAEASYLITNPCWKPAAVRRYQGDILRTEETYAHSGRYAYELSERYYELDRGFNKEHINERGRWNAVGVDDQMFEKQYQKALALTKERKS